MTDTTIPERYVIRTTYTTCLGCGQVATSSDFLALSYIRARHAKGAPVRHYEACSRPLYNLPVSHTAVPSTTAFCIRCHKVDLSYLPPPPNPSQLHDLAEPAMKNAPVRKAPPTPRQPKLSIKDLA